MADVGKVAPIELGAVTFGEPRIAMQPFSDRPSGTRSKGAHRRADGSERDESNGDDHKGRRVERQMIGDLDVSVRIWRNDYEGVVACAEGIAEGGDELGLR